MDEKNISKTHDDIQCKIKIKRRIVNNQLKGKVTIGSPTPLNIDRAYIEITGIANCSWKLDSMCFKFPRIYPENTPVKGFQQFYYTRHSLCGGDIAHRHKGTESYPFVAYWPSRLPGTWYGDHGSIEYLAKVTLHLAKNADIFNYSQFVAVIPRRHLSTEKHLLFEGRIDVTRSFQTYRAEGYVTVSVWLPISGIAAGQGLPVLCSITNCSRLHFGSILFMLTRTDIYRSDTPVATVKKVRTDICRVARMVNIHKGQHDFYVVMQTDADTYPTNQFHRLLCIQTIYEVWVSVQGSFRRYRCVGYPNIDTPGIPIIIGTKPIKEYNIYEISSQVFRKVYDFDGRIYMDELPEDFRQIIHTTDEELSKEAVLNLERQLLVNEQLLNTLGKVSTQKVASAEIIA
ncbi:uncharacterized protein LOC135131531 [Zophobas morio]|uniref:uncharacterized protein LOC135131531 n=1 Tax=Zophobas morio TaxID=2755281 RepID=UPI003083DD21